MGTANEEPRNYSALLEAAERQVDALKAAALLRDDEKRRLRLTAWVSTASASVLVIILIITCALAWNGYYLARHVQDASVSQCEDGNATRMADEQRWEFFISTALGPKPGPAERAEAQRVLDNVKVSDAPRDCQQAYGVSLGEQEGGNGNAGR
jgi:hypothetical protein